MSTGTVTGSGSPAPRRPRPGPPSLRVTVSRRDHETLKPTTPRSGGVTLSGRACPSPSGRLGGKPRAGGPRAPQAGSSRLGPGGRCGGDGRMRGPPSAEATEVRFVTRPASQAEATGMRLSLRPPTEPTQGAIGPWERQPRAGSLRPLRAPGPKLAGGRVCAEARGQLERPSSGVDGAGPQARLRKARPGSP